MLSTKIFNNLILQEGIEYIGNFTVEEEQSIKKAQRKNDSYIENLAYKNALFNAVQNRFNVPQNKSKQFYINLLKTTQTQIDYWKGRVEDDNEDFYSESVLEELIEKKKKLKSITKSVPNVSFKSDIERAKAYPIENLLKFSRSGFAPCFLHIDKTPSLKLYKKTNSAYCFSCHTHFDSIDIYRKLNNVSLSEAINSLK